MNADITTRGNNEWLLGLFPRHLSFAFLLNVLNYCRLTKKMSSTVLKIFRKALTATSKKLGVQTADLIWSRDLVGFQRVAVRVKRKHHNPTNGSTTHNQTQSNLIHKQSPETQTQHTDKGNLRINRGKLKDMQSDLKVNA